MAARSNRRPAATRSEIAGKRGVGGSSSASWLTLIPIPQTTRLPDASSRIPATLPPSTRTSFGHLTSAGTMASRSSVVATASPATSESSGRALPDGGWRSTREEQVRRRRVLPAPAGAAAAGRLVLRQRQRRRGGSRRRAARPASSRSRRSRGTARRTRRGEEGGRVPARAHSLSPTRRSRFVALRRFFDSRRFSRAARDGFVGTRLRSTRSASARRATSRSIASSRLRSWLRSSWATARRTGPALPTTRCFWFAVSAVDASTSKTASTRVSDVFACWPPGPLERETRSSIS